MGFLTQMSNMRNYYSLITSCESDQVHPTHSRCFPWQPITATEGRVRVEARKNLSCFVIEGAEREDESNYTICVTNPAGEDKAMLFIKIVGG